VDDCVRPRAPRPIGEIPLWQVDDTAKALYAVEDFTHFVATQTETAVRHTASSYPYDSRGTGALPCATTPRRSR
jgi:hypothetical protein